MDSQERKPLAPDRPGRYELRNGQTASVFRIGSVVLSTDYIGYWARDGQYLDNDKFIPDYDIIALAPDDAAWCLAQARLLCPEGYAVMQLSHIVSSELARQTLAQLMHVAKCNCWACDTFRLIASAAEGK